MSKLFHAEDKISSLPTGALQAFEIYLKDMENNPQGERKTMGPREKGKAMGPGLSPFPNNSEL